MKGLHRRPHIELVLYFNFLVFSHAQISRYVYDPFWRYWTYYPPPTIDENHDDLYLLYETKSTKIIGYDREIFQIIDEIENRIEEKANLDTREEELIELHFYFYNNNETTYLKSIYIKASILIDILLKYTHFIFMGKENTGAPKTEIHVDDTNDFNDKYLKYDVENNNNAVTNAIFHEKEGHGSIYEDKHNYDEISNENILNEDYNKNVQTLWSDVFLLDGNIIYNFPTNYHTRNDNDMVEAAYERKNLNNIRKAAKFSNDVFDYVVEAGYEIKSPIESSKNVKEAIVKNDYTDAEAQYKILATEDNLENRDQGNTEEVEYVKQSAVSNSRIALGITDKDHEGALGAIYERQLPLTSNINLLESNKDNVEGKYEIYCPVNNSKKTIESIIKNDEDTVKPTYELYSTVKGSNSIEDYENAVESTNEMPSPMNHSKNAVNLCNANEDAMEGTDEILDTVNNSVNSIEGGTVDMASYENEPLVNNFIGTVESDGEINNLFETNPFDTSRLSKGTIGGYYENAREGSYEIQSPLKNQFQSNQEEIGKYSKYFMEAIDDNFRENIGTNTVEGIYKLPANNNVTDYKYTVEYEKTCSTNASRKAMEIINPKNIVEGSFEIQYPTINYVKYNNINGSILEAKYKNQFPKYNPENGIQSVNKIYEDTIEATYEIQSPVNNSKDATKPINEVYGDHLEAIYDNLEAQLAIINSGNNSETIKVGDIVGAKDIMFAENHSIDTYEFKRPTKPDNGNLVEFEYEIQSTNNNTPDTETINENYLDANNEKESLKHNFINPSSISRNGNSFVNTLESTRQDYEDAVGAMNENNYNTITEPINSGYVDVTETKYKQHYPIKKYKNMENIGIIPVEAGNGIQSPVNMSKHLSESNDKTYEDALEMYSGNETNIIQNKFEYLPKINYEDYVSPFTAIDTRETYGARNNFVKNYNNKEIFIEDTEKELVDPQSVTKYTVILDLGKENYTLTDKALEAACAAQIYRKDDEDREQIKSPAVIDNLTVQDTIAGENFEYVNITDYTPPIIDSSIPILQDTATPTVPVENLDNVVPEKDKYIPSNVAFQETYDYIISKAKELEKSKSDETNKFINYFEALLENDTPMSNINPDVTKSSKIFEDNIIISNENYVPINNNEVSNTTKLSNHLNHIDCNNSDIGNKFSYNTVKDHNVINEFITELNESVEDVQAKLEITDTLPGNSISAGHVLPEPETNQNIYEKHDNYDGCMRSLYNANENIDKMITTDADDKVNDLFTYNEEKELINNINMKNENNFSDTKIANEESFTETTLDKLNEMVKPDSNIQISQTNYIVSNPGIGTAIANYETDLTKDSVEIKYFGTEIPIEYNNGFDTHFTTPNLTMENCLISEIVNKNNDIVDLDKCKYVTVNEFDDKIKVKQIIPEISSLTNEKNEVLHPKPVNKDYLEMYGADENVEDINETNNVRDIQEPFKNYMPIPYNIQNNDENILYNIKINLQNMLLTDPDKTMKQIPLQSENFNLLQAHKQNTDVLQQNNVSYETTSHENSVIDDEIQNNKIPMKNDIKNFEDDSTSIATAESSDPYISNVLSHISTINTEYLEDTSIKNIENGHGKTAANRILTLIQPCNYNNYVEAKMYDDVKDNQYKLFPIDINTYVSPINTAPVQNIPPYNKNEADIHNEKISNILEAQAAPYTIKGKFEMYKPIENVPHAFEDSRLLQGKHEQSILNYNTEKTKMLYKDPIDVLEAQKYVVSDSEQKSETPEQNFHMPYRDITENDIDMFRDISTEQNDPLQNINIAGHLYENFIEPINAQKEIYETIANPVTTTIIGKYKTVMNNNVDFKEQNEINDTNNYKEIPFNNIEPKQEITIPITENEVANEYNFVKTFPKTSETIAAQGTIDEPNITIPIQNYNAFNSIRNEITNYMQREGVKSTNIFLKPKLTPPYSSKSDESVYEEAETYLGNNAVKVIPSDLKMYKIGSSTQNVGNDATFSNILNARPIPNIDSIHGTKLNVKDASTIEYDNMKQIIMTDGKKDIQVKIDDNQNGLYEKPVHNVDTIAEKIQTILNQELKDNKKSNQNKKVFEIGNISVVPDNPNIQKCMTRTISTEDPNIILISWPSKTKIIKLKLLIESSALDILNFMPITKTNSDISMEYIENIAKETIRKLYGEPIVLKGDYTSYKPYVIVCNKEFDNLNVLWPLYSTSC